MNSKAKKLAQSVRDQVEVLERTLDEIESRGYNIVRFKTREMSRSTTITRVRGFEVFGVDITSKVRTLVMGPANVYPSVDRHGYVYLPATKKNLERLAKMFDNKRYVCDDSDYIDEILAIATKKGLPTSYTKKSDQPVRSDEEIKLGKLEELRKLVELKQYDEEISRLQLLLEPTVQEEPVKEPKAPAKAPAK